MSLEALTWVKNLDYDVCTMGPFRVLLILAEHANAEGQRAWRSKRKIANTLGVSERSVQRWFKDLIDARLIAPGDQDYVEHLPGNYRPVVYNLMLHRDEHFQQSELPENLGETGLSTGSSGETAVVALGETTAVVSRNQVLEPVKTSIKANHSTQAHTNEDAFGAHSRSASATVSGSSSGTCHRGHPYIDVSGGGVPFCASGCSPIATTEETEVHA